MHSSETVTRVPDTSCLARAVLAVADIILLSYDRPVPNLPIHAAAILA